MKTKDYDIAIGVFILIGLFLLGVMILRLGGGGAPGAQYKMIIKFNDVGGLIEGAPVHYRGVPCGTVRDVIVPSIDAEDNRIRVVVSISCATQIRKSDLVEITALNFMGDKILNITPVDPDAPLITPGDFLIGKEHHEIMSMAAKALEALANEETQTDIRRLIDNLGALVDEEMRESLRASIDNLNEASLAIRRIFTDEATADLKATIANLRKASEFMVENMERFNQFLSTAEETAENMNSVLVSLKDIAATVRKGEGSLGKFVYESDLYDNLDKLVEGLEKWGITTYLKEKEKAERVEARRRKRREELQSKE